MHVGGVRTALYAWLLARQNKKNGGQFILRIEDTDKEREVEGSIKHIQESLNWLGLDWDQGPYIQSERLEIYKKYADILIEKGLAYADPYTEEEIENFRKEAEENKKPFLFREHRPDNISAWDGTKPLRFKVSEIKRTDWNDLVWGELSAGPEALDDFILIKSDGYPTYNFAHIVDDIEMGVTHVVRGQEFISSTPKFLSLYEALGAKPPHFATTPPIMAPDGKKKLSKRDGAKDLLEYQKEGYLPDAMINYLAFLGFNPGGEKEVYTREELTEVFDLSKVQRGGARWDDAKLDWINKEHTKGLTDSDFVEKAKTFIDKEIINAKNLTEEELYNYILLFKDRITKFGELNDLMRDVVVDDDSVTVLNDYLLPNKDPAIRETELILPKDLKDTPEVVVEYLSVVKNLIEKNDWEKILKKDNENELWVYAGEHGRGKVLLPIRVALSGQDKSIDLFDIMKAIGKIATLRRIDNAICRLKIPEKELNTEAKNNIPTKSDTFTNSN
jgi:glutamyl-tRNA synthetase